MKLHRLTIENIASIEHAVIDFNVAPLTDEHLFLITGETGSGKSTIIDCLCLALYGNTPRMKAAKNAKYENRINSDRKDELTTNTPKQLMRRGSVQASVELTFEDNSGIPYIATWEVHRANGKAGGKISNIARCLRTADGVTSPVHYTKYGDIDDHIGELIGLDMDQFFRTVVLAQGKFAEFLNSDEKEKSDLLEKMTGTEIYTQIGKKIHTVCQDKLNTCKILRGQMENITLLNEEQKAKINEEMGQLDGSRQTVDGQLKQASAMVKWVDDKNRIDKNITDTSQHLKDTQGQTTTAEYQAQESLVKDWDATAEARHHLKENRKATTRIRELEQQKIGLQEEFDRLCAQLRAAEADITQKQKKADEIGQSIANEAPNKAMYDAIGQIVTLFSQWRDKRKNIDDYTSDLAKDEKRLPEALEAVKNAKASAEQQDEVVKQLKKQQDNYDITNISTRLNDLNRAYRALETLKDKHDAVSGTEDLLTKLKNKQVEEKSKLDQMASTIGEKSVRKEACQQQLERMTDWNQLLIQAQRSLHEGETCPVCGNTITRLLAPKAESELDELKQQLKLADDDLQQTLTLVKATEKAIIDDEKRINDTGKELLKKQDERAAHWNSTLSLLAKCGKNADEMADKTEADRLISEIEGMMAQLNDQLKQASELARNIQAAQQQLDKAMQARHKAEMYCSTLKDSITHQRQLIETSKNEAVKLASQLDLLLVMKDWREHADDEFISGLQARAADYQKLVTSKQELAQFIELRSTAIKAITQAKGDIKGLSDNGNSTDVVPDDLEERWRGFGSRYVQWNTQLDNAKDNATATKQALDSYCESHADVTVTRLTELIGHSQEEIDGIKREHQTLSASISSMKGAIETLTRQREELNGKKPDFNEENPERLEAFIAEKQGVLNGLTAQIADFRAQLIADEERAKMFQDKQARLEQAEAECARWEDFNNKLGSADGAKFRKIAQSYILGDLLAKANGFLRQFDNRFELEPCPGSLIILVRDLIQGDLTSATTLSGGESFMVSLALALALSSMTGRVFSVDTIFIDEGFGSLSPNYLDKVMETLNRLYDMGGRRVGIISHVEMLKERVPTQIQVYRDPDNNTVSRVKVTG